MTVGAIQLLAHGPLLGGIQHVLHRRWCMGIAFGETLVALQLSWLDCVCTGDIHAHLLQHGARGQYGPSDLDHTQAVPPLQGWPQAVGENRLCGRFCDVHRPYAMTR